MDSLIIKVFHHVCHLLDNQNNMLNYLNPKLNSRVPVQVGVNVPASRKKERSESVRVAGRAGRAAAPDTYIVYKKEQRDQICVCFIIATKVPSRKTREYGTQLWAIAVVSLITLEILFDSHFIHPHSS